MTNDLISETTRKLRRNLLFVASVGVVVPATRIPIQEDVIFEVPIGSVGEDVFLSSILIVTLYHLVMFLWTAIDDWRVLQRQVVDGCQKHSIDHRPYPSRGFFRFLLHFLTDPMKRLFDGKEHSLDEAATYYELSLMYSRTFRFLLMIVAVPVVVVVLAIGQILHVWGLAMFFRIITP